MAPTLYPGQPLKAGEIRLIKIRPGVWNDPIQCSLHNTSRESATYYTLSYVWGSRGVSRHIVVENQDYATTVNLERALRYLRNRYYEVYLWIDAICINQEDVKERTSQVGVMDQIYKHSRKVIVFLGDRLEDKAPKPNSDIRGYTEHDPFPPRSTKLTPESKGRQGCDAYDAFSFIHQLSLNKHLYEIPALETNASHRSKSQNNDTYDESDELEVYENRKRTNEQTRTFESLRRLMHGPYTPWWNRVWVIQEVTLPPEIEIIHGDMVVPWSMFAMAARNYSNHAWRPCCSHIPGVLPRDHVKVLSDFSQRVSDIEELRDTRHKRPGSLLDPKNTTLLALLRRFRDRRATDARDKVYALFGLAHWGAREPPMKPDYSLNEVQVFCMASITCIRAIGLCSIFNTELGRKFRTDLPSWVPDWSAPGGYSHDVRAAALDLYDEFPKSKAVIEESGDNELVIDGDSFAEISHVGDAMWGDAQSAVSDTLESWWELWSQHSDETKNFWRTICADVVCSPHTLYVRRTEPLDELKFATWALQSKRSPFNSWDHPFNNLWSKAARTWQALLLLWPGREFLDIIDVSSAEDLVPCGLEDAKELRIHLVRQLVRFANNGLTEDQMIDNLDEFRKDAPWKHLLDVIGNQFYGEYPKDFYVSFQCHLTRWTDLIDNSIMAATLSRKLIGIKKKETQNVFFGLGPLDTSVGDTVFLLMGGQTPFVMRQDTQPIHESYFRYLDNIWWQYRDRFTDKCGPDLSKECSDYFALPYDERGMPGLDWSSLSEERLSFLSSNCKVSLEGLVKESDYSVYEELCTRRDHSFAPRYQILGDCYLHCMMHAEEVMKMAGNLPDGKQIRLV